MKLAIISTSHRSPGWLSAVWLSLFLFGPLIAVAEGPTPLSGPVMEGPRLNFPSPYPWNNGPVDIAMLPDGSLVAVWIRREEGGEPRSWRMQKVSPSGIPVGPERTVADENAVEGRLVNAADGSFALIWSTGGDIKAQRFLSTGDPNGAELQVNTYTTGTQTGPSADMLADGSFVVSWVDQSPADHDRVRGRRYDSAGAPVSGELQLQQSTTGSKDDSAVALMPDGGFVAAWPSGGLVLNAGIFDSAGVPVTGDFQVSDPHPNFPYRHIQPALLVQDNGDFVVAWSADYFFYGAYLNYRRFSSVGTPLPTGPDFRIAIGNSYAWQQSPGLTRAPDDGFILVWSYYGLGGPGRIEGKVFESDGSVAHELVIDAGNGYEMEPRIASQGSDFVIMWQEDIDFGDAFAQRLSFDYLFADGFEQEDTSRWSSAVGN